MYEIPTTSESIVYFKNDDKFLVKSVIDENCKVVFTCFNRLTGQSFLTSDSTIFISVLEVFCPEVFNQLLPSKCLNTKSLKNVPSVLSARKNVIKRECQFYSLIRIPKRNTGLVQKSRIEMAKPVITAISIIKSKYKN